MTSIVSLVNAFVPLSDVVRFRVATYHLAFVKAALAHAEPLWGYASGIPLETSFSRNVLSFRLRGDPRSHERWVAGLEKSLGRQRLPEDLSADVRLVRLGGEEGKGTLLGEFLAATLDWYDRYEVEAPEPEAFSHQPGHRPSSVSAPWSLRFFSKHQELTVRQVENWNRISHSTYETHYDLPDRLRLELRLPASSDDSFFNVEWGWDLLRAGVKVYLEMLFEKGMGFGFDETHRLLKVAIPAGTAQGARMLTDLYIDRDGRYIGPPFDATP
jgi:hypothetical protein